MGTFAVDGALLASALLMGLAGAPHCAAMCGAAFASLSGGALARERTRARLALLAGRLAGYAAMGALLASSLSFLGALHGAAPVMRPLWGLVHVGAFSLGVWLAWTARAPAWLSAANPRLVGLAGSQPVRWLGRVPPAGRAGLAGACWVALPCGLLQSALLVSSLATGPAAGAAVMAAFAISSSVGLWLGPQLWSMLRRRGDDARGAAVSVRLAGLLLAGTSAFALWHGIGAAIDQALCVAAA